MSQRENFLASFAPLPEGVALPPELLAEYEVETCLTRKEQGGAWRLRRRADGALFTLKLVPAGTEDLEEEQAILTRLAGVLPGAIPAPGAHFRAGEMDCLLRGYLEGETLEAWREREGSGTEQACIRLGRQMCALLDTLHHQDPPVIHRDIKPEHIILTPGGGVGLIDFGIARQYKDGRDSDTRQMGTRITAAPEQYGYAQSDQRTDLYALGMTLIWLLTGKYDREALAQVPGVSPHLRRTLEKAVAFAPEARFQSAAAFSAALAGRSRRRRALWAGAAALLCALLLGGGFLWSGGRTADRPADTALPTDLPTPTQAPQPVTFTSRSMEAAVRQALDKPEGEITYRELEDITFLAPVGENTFDQESAFDYRVSCYIDNVLQNDLSLGDITDADLALLAHMPNLEALYLCRQEIKDISVLAGLPLTTLALCEDRIMDFSPLAALTELETLYLGGNPGTDYSVLSGLTRLETLRVEGSGTAGLAAVEADCPGYTFELRTY